MLTSVAYCTKRLEDVGREVNDYIERGERLPAELKALNRNLALTKGRLESGCQNGQIQIGDYVTMLETLVKKDLALCKYL